MVLEAYVHSANSLSYQKLRTVLLALCPIVLLLQLLVVYYSFFFTPELDDAAILNDHSVPKNGFRKDIFHPIDAAKKLVSRGIRKRDSHCWNEVDEGVVTEIRSASVELCNDSSSPTSIQSFSYIHPHYTADSEFGDGQRSVEFLSSMWNTVVLNFIDTPTAQFGAHSFITPTHIVCASESFEEKGNVLFNSMSEELGNAKYSCQKRKYDDIMQNNSTDMEIIAGKVVAIFRTKPLDTFFQLSSALNTWIMMQVLQWNNPSNTTLLVLDDSPSLDMIELHRGLISSLQIRYINEFHGKFVAINQLLFAPTENTGPLAAHLQNAQSCGSSFLLRKFKSDVLTSFQAERDERRKSVITVTILSFEKINFTSDPNGVDVQDLYQHVARYSNVTAQKLNFSDLSMKQRIQTLRETDMLIGIQRFHLAHAFWLPDDAQVLDFSPLSTRHNGIRNICSYAGCEYLVFGDDDLARQPEKEQPTWKSFLDVHVRRALERKSIGLREVS